MSTVDIRQGDQEGGTLKPLTRVFIGICGGLSAAAVKFLAQDMPLLNELVHRTQEYHNQLQALIQINMIVVPILMFLGAVVAFSFEEKSKMKLLLAAAAAPSMFTTVAGGPDRNVNNLIPTETPKLEQRIGPAGFNLDFSIVSPAYAGASSPQTANPSFLDSLQAYFGVARTPDQNTSAKRFYVIVRSIKDQNEATREANRLNQIEPQLKAFVGKRIPGNPYYPVIVGDYLTLPEARQLMDAVKDLPGIEPPYLSAFPDRR